MTHMGHQTTGLTADCIRILEGAGYTVVPPGPPHSEHYAVFGEDDWWTEHSIQCRVNGEMPTCAIHKAVKGLADRMQGQGRFLVVTHEDTIHLERADDE